MDSAEFDKFADEYRSLHDENIRASGESHEYFVEYKVRDIYHQMRTAGDLRANLKILDFGAGVGSSIPFFQKYFPSCEVLCADVSRRSLDVAQRRFGATAKYVVFQGTTLPLRSGSFDIAVAACVFHHIPSSEHVGWLREIRRVLANNGGRLFLYEHNPLNPLTARAVANCAFDRDAVLVPAWKMRKKFRAAGYADISLHYRVFFPRFLAPLRFLEFQMWWLPLGAQYCIVGLVPPLAAEARH
jgi:ubiquinone/menaquinone biosynthesis C-methylase UbiE